MSFLWATNHMCGFDRFYGLIENGDTVADFDTTYVNSAIRLWTDSRMDKILPVGQSELWVHFEIEPGRRNTLIDDSFFYIGDETTGIDLFTVTVNNGACTVQYWDGTALVNTAIAFTLTAALEVEIDIHIIMDDSANGDGLIELYKDGVLQGTSFEGDTIHTAALTLDRIGLRASTNTFNVDTNFSQIIVANESTLGCKLAVHTIDADGNSADWTGDYTDIPTGADSVFQNTSIAHSDTADQVMLVEPEDIISTALFPRGIVVNANAKRGVTGPDSIALVVRSDGVDHVSADMPLSEGYQSVFEIWEADPAGPKNWLEATLNAMEVGVKSRAS